jgi:exopolysaccharide biosynthesis polyprenyl glycosylphosphotransferase
MMQDMSMALGTPPVLDLTQPAARPAPRAEPATPEAALSHIQVAPVPAVVPAAGRVPAEFERSVDTVTCLGVLLGVWMAAGLGTFPGGINELLKLPITLRHALLGGLFALLWPRLFALFGVYDPARAERRADTLWRIVLASGVGSMVALQFVLPTLAGTYRAHAAVALWAAGALAAVAVRLPVWALAGSAARTRVPRRVLIIGSGPRARRLRDQITASPEGGVELMGWVDGDDHAAVADMSLPKLCDLDGLEHLLMHQVVDEVLIALPIKSCYADIERAIQVCARVGVESRYLADAFHVSVARRRLEQHRALPFLTIKTFCDDHRVTIKRAVDIVGSLAGLALLAPLLLGIALAIKLTSRGPVLFAQERYGQNKRRFRMFKFRTMVPNAEALIQHLEEQNEAAGPIFKIRNDPRVTPVGRWLRKTSLDELPQLWNVLRGEMSLVGPRPMAVRDVQLFDQAWFMRRFSAPPGMTGLWQVSGRSNLGFDDWVTLDLKYIDEWSLAMDVRILARTFPTVLRGVGAA